MPKRLRKQTGFVLYQFEDTDLKKALKMTLDDGEAAAIVLALEQKALMSRTNAWTGF